MMRTHFALLALLSMIALPLAAAQDGADQRSGEVEVDAPDNVDVDVDDDANDVEEATFAGLSTTVVIILIVLAVLVVALIVAMASRP